MTDQYNLPPLPPPSEPTQPPVPPPPPPPRSPFEAPQAPVGRMPLRHDQVREKLKIVSIVLMVWTVLSIGVLIFGMVMQAVSGTSGMESYQAMLNELLKGQQNDAQMEQMLQSLTALNAYIQYFQLIILFLVLLGSSKMFKAEGYGLAFAGAILASVPCLGSGCCCLGMIPGIWSLVLLLQPEIKAGFR